MARTMMLVAAVVVVVAPGPLPGWLAPTGNGLAVGDLLPAAFAVIAGMAVAHQVAAHGGASPAWWTARLTRRVVVLVAAGLLLQLLVGLPDPAQALTGLRLTGDLARIGVATAAALLLARLPPQSRTILALALLVGHAVLVFGADTPAAQGGTLAGWDAELLGGRALHPIDPDGVSALAPTFGLVLLGVGLGGWLRQRARGAGTAGLLLAGAGAAAIGARLLERMLAPLPAVWSPPVLSAGLALVLAVLAAGHLGTRRGWSDRWVAALAVAGQVTLPLWLLAVVGERWLGDAAPVRWLLRHVLWPPFGDRWAALVLGVLVAAGLVRLGGVLVDRGWQLRA